MSKTLVVTLTRKRGVSAPDPAPLPVTLTPHAQERLRAAYLIASTENRPAADLWLRTMRDKIAGLAGGDHPVAPESRLFGMELRELVLSEFALRILFRIEKASVQVLDLQRLQTNCRGA